MHAMPNFINSPFTPRILNRSVSIVTVGTKIIPAKFYIYKIKGGLKGKWCILPRDLNVFCGPTCSAQALYRAAGIRSERNGHFKRELVGQIVSIFS